MRLVTTVLAAGWTAVVVSGCGVPQDMVGIYSNPHAGLISLDDEWRGVYKHFPEDVRAVRGDYTPATIDDVRAGNPEEIPPVPFGPTGGRPRAPEETDEPSWDQTWFEFRVEADIVTLLPHGGEPVNLRLVDGDLVLMQPGGFELVFRR